MPADSSRAVFLSYAREDTDAARRIAEALRGFGVEVWFDQNELRGGDAWDAKIRGQIGGCALFVPLISRQTDARPKGYFRLEWKLAVEQTHLLADGVPFIAPVAIDDTRETGAVVPAEFLRVQWMRLPGALPTPEFVEQIKRLLQPSSPGASRTGPRDETRPTRAVRVPPWLWGFAALVVLAVGTMVFIRKPQPAVVPVAEAKQAPTDAMTPRLGDKSIAVLPFENLSAEAENAFIASGVHEDLLTNLAKIRSLRVISRTSMLRYRERPDNLRKVAEELGVAYLVEGSVRRAGNRVLVTAQLISGRSDEHLWADNFEEEVKDLFALQRRIAEQIAARLQARLSPEESASLAAPPTSNIEAFRLCQQARDLMQGSGAQFVGIDADRFQTAIDLLKKAIALDPKYLRAWVELSVAHLEIATANNTGVEVARRRAAQAEAERAVQRAREIAPTDPWTGFAAAHLIYRTGGVAEYPVALAELAKATAVLPHESEFVRLEARIRRRSGDLAQAVALNESALAIDPNSVSLWRERWENLQIMSAHKAVAAAAARLVELEPTVVRWRYEQARAMFFATAASEHLQQYRALTENRAMPLAVDRESSLLWLWEAQNDRAALVQFADQPRTELALRTRRNLMMALWGAGERERARVAAADFLQTVKGYPNLGPYYVESYAAMGGFIGGNAVEGAASYERAKAAAGKTNAYDLLARRAELLYLCQFNNPDEAAATLLGMLAGPYSGMSLDRIAAGHWTWGTLLGHPKIKERIVQQGTWLRHLADRVPDYAEFKAKR